MSGAECEYSTESIKSQVLRLLYKAQRVFDVSLFISVKLPPREQRRPGLLGHPEGSGASGSRFSFASVPLPPSGRPSSLPLPTRLPLHV